MHTISLLTRAIALLILVAFVGSVSAVSAQQSPASTGATRPPDPARFAPVPSAQFRAPDDIDFRTANITSEGVRLHAELFSLKSLAGKPLPTIIQAHGWGGTAANLRRDAVDMAAAGFLVITFDYRGWGESDARLILTAPSPVTPKSGQNQKFTAEVVEQREYVDPLEQTTDWFNVIHWAAGETAVDKDRIGLRGSSFSGGHVVYVAAREPRVKAAVSQVASLDGRWVGADREQLEITRREASARAHGEAYPAPRSVVVGRLIGAPIRQKFMHFAPVEDAAAIRDAAILFIVAEKEELFDNKDHAKLAYDRMPGAKKKYVSIPNITHYGIYRESRDEAIRLAIEWFDQYLKK
ncbi:MAG: acetylxylan esterase [Acidobacteria bacterium]|nr:acetylxylan esterase [Acidobacteriota bacterium]MCW5967609.1 acetylxylan esterase [Blastocatellales bacterium]